MSEEYHVRIAAGNRQLVQEHHPEAIRRRLAETPGQGHLSDAVLGAIDGCVTTFAVVAGAGGGGFSRAVIIVLGAANLVADGLSMAVGNYQAARTRRQTVETARQTEERHVDEVPQGEREEVRQIFAAKGFAGETLEKVVDVITADRTVWIDTMLKEEIGVHPLTPPPSTAALVTFCAFVASGSIPLLPFLLPGMPVADAFWASAMATAIAFLAIGGARGRLLGASALRSAGSTLMTGGAAAALAYLIAAGLRRAFGASL
jgi:VIT1/CCC1 family predicted Fe2+/Mn2+ transporter